MARPSAEMVLQLAAPLDVPLRHQNQLLLAAGYAPVYGQRGLDDPEMGPVRDTLEFILRGHDPYPAMVVDRHWGIVSANRAFGLLTEGAAPELLEPPANVPDWRSTRTASLRGSSTLPSSARRCCCGSGARQSPPAIRHSPRSTRS